MTWSDAFAHVEMLWLLPLAAPLFFGLRRAAAAARQRTTATLGDRADELTASLDDRARARRAGFLAAAWIFGVVAAAQPHWGFSGGAPRGAEILVCLDVSRSMLAEDAAPSRLLAAKAAIRALSEAAEGDRIGLIAFAGEARLVVPLTRDRESFVQLLDRVDPWSVRKGGSDLGAALDAALAALSGLASTPGSFGSAAIILVTDGEDLGGRGAVAAAACRARGVVVHTVGFGSTRGSKIAATDGSSANFVRDGAGGDVVSALDAGGLRRIADLTGGAFSDGTTTPQPLTALYADRILPDLRRKAAAGEGAVRTPRFQWPLALALAFFLFDACSSERRRR